MYSAFLQTPHIRNCRKFWWFLTNMICAGAILDFNIQQFELRNWTLYPFNPYTWNLTKLIIYSNYDISRCRNLAFQNYIFLASEMKSGPIRNLTYKISRSDNFNNYDNSRCHHLGFQSSIILASELNSTPFQNPHMKFLGILMILIVITFRAGTILHFKIVCLD